MIKIAFAGFRHGHILALYAQAKESPLVKIVGAYEADRETRERVARESGVCFTYESYEALLADREVDAVAIGDYYAKRGELAIRALESGKHVISDKPLCTEREEEKRIRALAEKKGLCVYLMLDLRFEPQFQTVKRLIEEGTIGRIAQIRFGGQHPLLRKERPSWYFEKGKHGGVINDIAVHGIDLIRYMCGTQPKRVLAARCFNAFAEDVPHFLDAGSFMCEMENGATLMADVSYASPDGMLYDLPQYWEFEIWGLRGVLRFGKNHKNIELYRKESSEVEIISPAPVEKTLIEDFVACVQGEKNTVLTVAEALDATRATLEIQKYSEK